MAKRDQLQAGERVDDHQVGLIDGANVAFNEGPPVAIEKIDKLFAQLGDVLAAHRRQDHQLRIFIHTD